MNCIFFLAIGWVFLFPCQRRAAEEDSSGPFFPSPDSISDVIIEPFPYPEGLEGLDITACIQGHRFAECEELLLEALPGAENNEEVTMYRYSMLGMVVEFQISMKQTQRKSPHRAFIGLFDQRGKPGSKR